MKIERREWFDILLPDEGFAGVTNGVISATKIYIRKNSDVTQWRNTNDLRSIDEEITDTEALLLITEGEE